MKITICDGKYTVTDENGKLEALRHGTPWRDLVGDNLIYGLASEIERLREENSRLSDAVRGSIDAYKVAHKQWRGFNMLDAGEKAAYEILRDSVIECEKSLKPEP